LNIENVCTIEVVSMSDVICVCDGQWVITTSLTAANSTRRQEQVITWRSRFWWTGRQLHSSYRRTIS